MFRLILIACALQMFVTCAWAQTVKLPPDLAGLPDEVKSLKWQGIDMKSVQPLEHCRALLLLNHTLEELSANAAAEADLMSAYIEKKNLGAQFASTPPPPAPSTLNYADAEQVAVAVLRGPMSTSYYATELEGLTASTLQSYEQMYMRTCQRRWSEFDESRHLVRCMSAFLGNGDKLQDYDAWATAEAAHRETEYQKRPAAAPAAAADAATQQKMEAQIQQQNRELMQMKGALAAAQAQQQQTQAAQSGQQPQAAQAPQQSGGQTLTAAGQPAQAVGGGYVVDSYPYYGPYGGYGGYGYYGSYGASPGAAAAAGAYAGANAANNADKNNAARTAAAGPYHGANSSWNRDASYNGAARSQTEQRMSSFHGARGRR